MFILAMNQIKLRKCGIVVDKSENLDETIEHLSQMNLIIKIDLEEIKSRIRPFGGKTVKNSIVLFKRV